jgi:NADPH2:quinone reductase
LNGSGPAAGTRVVGLAFGTGWAEKAAVSTTVLAAIPDELSFSDASTLPVAGLTAVRALALAERLDNKRILITGAAGGVGRFAVQLAKHGGAHVTAVVGRPERVKTLEALACADEIIVGDLPEDVSYDVILESVGGATLGAAIQIVAAGGLIVAFGNSSGAPTTFNVSTFGRGPGVRLYGMRLFDELQRHGSGVRDLSELARAAAGGRLDAGVGLELDWTEAATAMDALMARKVDGKAVLTIS